MKTNVLAVTLAATAVASSSMNLFSQSVQQNTAVPTDVQGAPVQNDTGNRPVREGVLNRPVRPPLVTGPSVALDLLPPAVQKTLREYSLGVPITDVAKVTVQGESVYQASFVHNGTNVLLQVAENGGLVRNAANDQYLASIHKLLPGQQAGPPASPPIVRDWATSPERLPLGAATPVSLTSLPESARQTLMSYSGGTAIGTIEQGTVSGRTVYQAALRPGGQRIELRVDTNGVVVNDQVNNRFLADYVRRQKGETPVGQPALTETAQGGAASSALAPLTDATTLPISQLPPAVRTTVGARAANLPIRQVTRGTLDGKNVYDVTYNQDGQPITLRITEDGSVLAPETKAP